MWTGSGTSPRSWTSTSCRLHPPRSRQEYPHTGLRKPAPPKRFPLRQASFAAVQRSSALVRQLLFASERFRAFQSVSHRFRPSLPPSDHIRRDWHTYVRIRSVQTRSGRIRHPPSQSRRVFFVLRARETPTRFLPNTDHQATNRSLQTTSEHFRALLRASENLISFPPGAASPSFIPTARDRFTTLIPNLISSIFVY